jgi:ubiquinone biosynthesis protein
MLAPFPLEMLTQFAPGDSLHTVLSRDAPLPDRIRAMQALLDGSTRELVRGQMGHWVVQFLPAEDLVPAIYAEWRPLVHDAMVFMLSHLSTSRLAPKLIEQIDLPRETTTEARLLRLIAKVPGLQKLGQVLARNRHLHPRLRRALTELENGIADVTAEEMRSILDQQLGARIRKHKVEIEAGTFLEASVSAVIRFTWHNPEAGQRERGVFKVLKPYIPECFAEDMHLLSDLAKYIGSKHTQYGFAEHVLPDTFQDVRRLLQHEVQFGREQKTLLQVYPLYRALRGVKVPRLIEPLCTRRVTAMTEEHGKKVTEAVKGLSPWGRRFVAERLVETLLAGPLFSPAGDVTFHADPHAGNLLYDKSTDQLTILDWALTERLSRDQRRHLALMFLMLALRNPAGVCEHIQALSRSRRRVRKQAQVIAHAVSDFIEQMPLTHFPGPVDAMNLLETIAYRGVRLPAPLLMLRKVLFTLDGILHDVAGTDVSMEFVMAQRLFKNWMSAWASFGSPLSLRDWILVQSSAALYPSRLLVQWEQKALRKSRGQRTHKARPRNSLPQELNNDKQSRGQDSQEKNPVLETA